MERHIELTHLAADLRKKIAEADGTYDSACMPQARRTGERLVDVLTAKHAGLMRDLWAVLIAHGEDLRKELARDPKQDPPPLGEGTIPALALGTSV